MEITRDGLLVKYCAMETKKYNNYAIDFALGANLSHARLVIERTSRA